MKKCFSLLVAAVAAIAFSPQSDAALVTGATGGGAGGTVTGFSGISHTATGGSGGSSTATGTITVDIDVLKLHTPFGIVFSYDAGGAQFTDYTVTLRVRNLVPSGQTYMNGFDLRNAGSSGIASAALSTDSLPTSDTFSMEVTPNLFNLPTNDGFRFGGLNGGGGSIYTGSPYTINTVVYTVTGGRVAPGTSTLNFTANPEPATLLLGSLALIPAGMVARRRRKAAQELVEAA